MKNGKDVRKVMTTNPNKVCNLEPEYALFLSYEL